MSADGGVGRRRGAAPAAGLQAFTAAAAVLAPHHRGDAVAALGPQRVCDAVGEDRQAYAGTAERGVDDLLLRRRHDEAALDEARSSARRGRPAATARARRARSTARAATVAPGVGGSADADAARGPRVRRSMAALIATTARTAVATRIQSSADMPTSLSSSAVAQNGPDAGQALGDRRLGAVLGRAGSSSPRRRRRARTAGRRRRGGRCGGRGSRARGRASWRRRSAHRAAPAARPRPCRRARRRAPRRSRGRPRWTWAPSARAITACASVMRASGKPIIATAWAAATAVVQRGRGRPCRCPRWPGSSAAGR